LHIDTDYQAAGPAGETVLAFELEHHGRRYQCRRTVRGTVRLSQHVEVIGTGERLDTGLYGGSAHSVETMENIARIIALELIKRHVPAS
jgi:hypothetical protein